MKVSVRSLIWSAFFCGSLGSFVVRPARRHRGWVVLARFSSPAPAGVFGRRWAARLGISVACSRVGAGVFQVSVPVAAPDHRLPGICRAIPIRGGGRSLDSLLFSVGFGR